MKHKNISIILSVLWIIVFSIICSFTLVFASEPWKISFRNSSTFFKDSLELSVNRVVFSSKNKPEDISITWNCNIHSKLLKTDWFNHIYDIRLLEDDCKESKFNVNFKVWEENIKTSFNIHSNYSLYSKFLDFSDENLLIVYKNINNLISELNNKVKSENYLEWLKNERKGLELKFLERFIWNIIEKRTQKYKIPVVWKDISTKLSKLPNAGRPYRESYTDWIHHWFDIDANVWDTVVSLADWMIIRVVNNFTYSDLGNIKYWENLTYEEELLNLDILRWNQIWIKTMKWDVAFYSHLNQIFPFVEEWTMLTKWEPIWTVWITWVPDKNYTDSHLHMPLHQNTNHVKPDSYLEIMKWDWYFKWKSNEYILENQTKFFE